jgi:hypothetical protein
MQVDSPDLVIAMRLIDSLKLCGLEFRRGSPGEDGPLVGHRISGDRVDLVLIEGFSRDCFAWRQRASSLIIPGNGVVERQVDGSAIDVPKGFLVHAHRHDYQYAAPGRGAHAHHRRP